MYSEKNHFEKRILNSELTLENFENCARAPSRLQILTNQLRRDLHSKLSSKLTFEKKKQS